MPKLTEVSKAKKNDSKFSTMTMPKTMPVQNILRYISFKALDMDLWLSKRTQKTSTVHRTVNYFPSIRKYFKSFKAINPQYHRGLSTLAKYHRKVVDLQFCVFISNQTYE